MDDAERLRWSLRLGPSSRRFSQQLRNGTLSPTKRHQGSPQSQLSVAQTTDHVAKNDNFHHEDDDDYIDSPHYIATTSSSMDRCTRNLTEATMDHQHYQSATIGFSIRRWRSDRKAFLAQTISRQIRYTFLTQSTSFLTRIDVVCVFAACDKSFCLWNGPGSFAVGRCETKYCDCDAGNNPYSRQCIGGLVYDTLSKFCNWQDNVEGCPAFSPSKSKA